MIVMFIVMGGAASVSAATAGQWIAYSLVGVLAGIAMGVSALWQGISAAAACDAFAETGKGFANQLMALGIVETVAIFVLAFSIVLLSSLGAA
jgi:V/A-type H+-transporting ATPase subunit K